MSIAFIIGIPLLVATFITIYFWKKDADSGFLGKTIPEFGKIWIWSLIVGIMLMGTVLNIFID
jgi:hypothetical protein